MKFSKKISIAAWLLFILHTVSAQNIGGGDAEDANIVNGTDSARVPGYVASGPGRCGGQLIHRDIVLTAAHCVSAFRVSTRVLISATTPNDPVETNDVAEWVRHEDFDLRTGEGGFISNIQNDIAVFRLKTPSNEPLTAWSTDTSQPNTGNQVRIVGFGSTGGDVPFSGADRLRQTILTVQDKAQCRDVYSAGIFQANQMACASNPSSTLCVGDSGSPLFDTTNNNIVGVASFAASGCSIGGKTVMTRVSNYDNWIREQICKVSKYPPVTCPATCGDGICTPNVEDVNSCSQDCLIPPPPSPPPSPPPPPPGDTSIVSIIINAIVSTLGTIVGVLFCLS